MAWSSVQNLSAVLHRTRDEAIATGCRVMHSAPQLVWTSDGVAGWSAPPAEWLPWPG